MSVYIKPYARNEFNFAVIIPTNGTENNVIIKTLNEPVELEIRSFGLRKTDGTATAVSVELNVSQLEENVTGGADGVAGVDYLRANRDLDREQELIDSAQLLIDDSENPLVINTLNELNLLRVGAVTTKDVADIQDLGENLYTYTLKRNTSYLFHSKVIAGNTGTSELIVKGILRDL